MRRNHNNYKLSGDVSLWGTRWCCDQVVFCTNATLSKSSPLICQIQKSRKRHYRMLNHRLNLHCHCNFCLEHLDLN